MAKFQIGEQVIHANSKEKGIIQDVMPPARGRQLYKVSINGEITNCLESNLIPDTNLKDPFEKIRRGMYGSHLDFSRISTTFKINNTSNNTISSLKASNTIFKAYQFKPLLKFLNSDNRRILVADEVGLGKTIEAGHIMLELMARHELRNALIICPKSLQEKWQIELKEKFNLTFKIYESAKEFRIDIREQGTTIKAIVNYEKIRLPKKDKDSKPKKKDLGLYEIIEEAGLSLDFVLCDEAHRLRNHTTQTHMGAKKLIEITNSVVFLTATPIMISEQNLFNLLQLLDEHKYSEYSTFQNELAVNAPFIKALSQLNNNVNLLTIADELSKAKVSLNLASGDEYRVEWSRSVEVAELFKDIPLYQRIHKTLTTEKDSHQTRVKLQFDISDMSEMNKVFSRTRKKEVTQDWSQAIREPHTEIVELDEFERKEFDKVIEEYIEDNLFVDEYGEERMPQGAALGLIQKKRQVASSVFGHLNSNTDLEQGIDLFESETDAKFERLLKIINEVVQKEGKKLIVFALFKATLKYLRIRLSRNGFGTALIHGDVEDRFSEIERFKTNQDVQILLSSEVGSEGLDMQFCDALVNYDLPWNPMVVEQRIGRIDRFGQKSPVINIYNLIVNDSIQEEIYTRLLDRIGIFRGSIGDLEAILDKDLERQPGLTVKNIRQWFNSLEKELYCKEITREQRLQRIDEIERAILTEKRNLDEISEGLTNALTNDVYFKNEIANIQNFNRYVTELELVRYVELLVRERLPTCQLKAVDEGKLIYTFLIPSSSPRELYRFIRQYQPNDNDSNVVYRKFLNQINDKSELDITFSQESGYENGRLIRISAYHPLITSAMLYFKEDADSDDNTFQFSLERASLQPQTEINSDEYFLAVYISRYIKSIHGKEQTVELLIPILFDIKNDRVVEDPEVAQDVLGASQLKAIPSASRVKLHGDLISELQYILAEEIENIEASMVKEERMRLESHKRLQYQRKSEYYENRIEQTERQVIRLEERALHSIDETERKNSERILPAQRKQLQNLLEERDKVLDEITASDLKFRTSELSSLSHISIV